MEIIHQLFADFIGEVIKQAGAIDEVVFVFWDVDKGFSAFFEQMMDGFFVDLNGRMATKAFFEFVKDAPGMLNGFLVEIEQMKIGMIGEQIVGKEFLDFTGRTATEVEHAYG